MLSSQSQGNWAAQADNGSGNAKRAMTAAVSSADNAGAREAVLAVDTTVLVVSGGVVVVVTAAQPASHSVPSAPTQKEAEEVQTWSALQRYFMSDQEGF